MDGVITNITIAHRHYMEGNLCNVNIAVIKHVNWTHKTHLDILKAVCGWIHVTNLDIIGVIVDGNNKSRQCVSCNTSARHNRSAKQI